MPAFVWFVLLVAAIVLAVNLLRGATVRGRVMALVDSSVAEPPGSLFIEQEESWLQKWLARAGYRSPEAASRFLAATAGSTAAGLLCLFVMKRLKVVEQMAATIELLPGLGESFVYVAYAAPYIILLICIIAPTLIVRGSRRTRVTAIEEDLALTLELLATLAEAGLAFDAALSRIQDSATAGRPLSEEFQIYQRDTLGGISRLAALRAMADRIDVVAVSIFVSALVQSEETGASLAETLRIQADELRDRRKLRALMLAQALPVKLAFPLIACFLPGIFFSTLGPVLSQLVDVVDSVVKRR